MLLLLLHYSFYASATVVSGGIVYLGSSCASVCVFWMLLTQYLEKYWTYFRKTYNIGAFWEKDENFQFWGQNVKGFRSQCGPACWKIHSLAFLTCYLKNYLTEFHQTFSIDALQDKDECVIMGVRRSNGQGHSMTKCPAKAQWCVDVEWLQAKPVSQKWTFGNWWIRISYRSEVVPIAQSSLSAGW